MKTKCDHKLVIGWVTEGWQDMSARQTGILKWCRTCGAIRIKDDWTGAWGRWKKPDSKLAKAK